MKYLQKFDNHSQYESADMPMYSVAYDEEHVHFVSTSKFFCMRSNNDALVMRVPEYDDLAKGYAYMIPISWATDETAFLFAEKEISNDATSIDVTLYQISGREMIEKGPVEGLPIIAHTDKGYRIDNFQKDGGTAYCGLFEGGIIFSNDFGNAEFGNEYIVGNPNVGDTLKVHFVGSQEDLELDPISERYGF